MKQRYQQARLLWTGKFIVTFSDGTWGENYRSDMVTGNKSFDKLVGRYRWRSHIIRVASRTGPPFAIPRARGLDAAFS